MKIGICEDESIFADKLKNGIISFFSEKNTEVETVLFPDSKSFTFEHNFDAIFLDINLGSGKDGVALAETIRETDKNVPLIFVTSLENRAIDGYDVGAFGFVVKKNLSNKLPVVLEKLYRELYCKRSIALSGKEETEIVNTDNILWVESMGRGALVHLTDGDFSDIRAIGHFSELLDSEDFVSVHKAIYVNISKIKRINTDTVTLCNDVSVPLSRRNRKNVMLAVMKKVGGK